MYESGRVQILEIDYVHVGSFPQIPFAPDFLCSLMVHLLLAAIPHNPNPHIYPRSISDLLGTSKSLASPLPLPTADSLFRSMTEQKQPSSRVR